MKKKAEQIVPWEKTLYKRIMMHMEMGYKPCKIEDPGKRNAAHQQKRWRENNPEKWRAIQDRSNLRRRTDPECIERRRELDRSPARKAYKKKYKQEHRERVNELHRSYNATDKGRATNSAYNKKWREEHREYDRKRKQEWWRRKHPNPRPIGRPRKEAA